MNCHALVFDFARVLLFPKQETHSSLGALYAQSSDTEIFALNTSLLNFIHDQRTKYTTAVLTNSGSLLAEGSHHRQKIEPYFDHIFLCKELGLRKDLPACYLKVAELLEVKTADILFIDDTWANCEAAQQAGCQVIHFHSTDQCISDLKKMLV